MYLVKRTLVTAHPLCSEAIPHYRIRLIEGNVKSSCLKSNLQWNFAAAVYLF